MIAIKRICYYTLLGIVLLTKNTFLPAQNNDSVLFKNDFFENDSVLQLTLKFDIKKFTNKKLDEEYLPATLSYFISDTIEIKKEVQIKSRGIIRKKICYFPPYFINIKNTGLQNNLFADLNKVKVVSHCENSKAYTNYLLKEYLAYKIFNSITDYSFKVRLLNVKYIDEGRKNKTFTYKAFIIEPEELLAERLELYSLNIDRFTYSQTDSILTATMSLFQYMIGNVDFSINGRHNIKMLITKDYKNQKLIPIPYDFDYSGLVNAHYAIPDEKLNIVKVTERFYRGLCRSDYLYDVILDIYREKKDEIYALIESFKYIDQKTRKEVLNFLDEFYDEIEDPDFVIKKIRTTCG